MGPIWGRQDPGRPHDGPMNFAILSAPDGSHVGPMNFAIWVTLYQTAKRQNKIYF